MKPLVKIALPLALVLLCGGCYLAYSHHQQTVAAEADAQADAKYQAAKQEALDATKAREAGEAKMKADTDKINADIAAQMKKSDDELRASQEHLDRAKNGN